MSSKMFSNETRKFNGVIHRFVTNTEKSHLEYWRLITDRDYPGMFQYTDDAIDANGNKVAPFAGSVD